MSERLGEEPRPQFVPVKMYITTVYFSVPSIVCVTFHVSPYDSESWYPRYAISELTISIRASPMVFLALPSQVWSGSRMISEMALIYDRPSSSSLSYVFSSVSQPNTC